MIERKIESLLILSPHYLTFVKDLTEKVAENINNVSVFVYSSIFYDLFYYFPPIGIIKGIKRLSRHNIIDQNNLPPNVYLHPVNMWYILPSSKNKNLGNKIFNKYKQIIKHNYKTLNINLIHAHFTWPSGYVAVKLGKELEIPVVITAHGYDVYDLPFRNKYWFNKIKYVLDSATHIITVSKSNERIMIEKLKISDKKISVIPNGYDGKLFHPMDKSEIRKKLHLPEDKKIIINVANLVPIKGHIYLLNALSEVIKHCKDIFLVIVGNGSERKKLEKVVSVLGLTKFVYFAGGKSHYEIPVWMNAADLFVLPSLSEGNPTVMFEALGVGLPFVGTAVGGVPDIIVSEDYGLLCPPKDSDRLSEKILEAFEKEWDREKIRKYAEQFTWENIAKEILEVYKNTGYSKMLVEGRD